MSNDYGRPGPAEPPEYYYIPCPYCEVEFDPKSGHPFDGCMSRITFEDGDPVELSDLSDPMDEMPESWLSPTPELEQEMTEWFEQADRLPDPDHN